MVKQGCTKNLSLSEISCILKCVLSCALIRKLPFSNGLFTFPNPLFALTKKHFGVT